MVHVTCLPLPAVLINLLMIRLRILRCSCNWPVEYRQTGELLPGDKCISSESCVFLLFTRQRDTREQISANSGLAFRNKVRYCSLMTSSRLVRLFGKETRCRNWFQFSLPEITVRSDEMTFYYSKFTPLFGCILLRLRATFTANIGLEIKCKLYSASISDWPKISKEFERHRGIFLSAVGRCFQSTYLCLCFML